MAKKTKVLVVEDSRFFRQLVSENVRKRIDADVVEAENFAGVQCAVSETDVPFDFALVDIVLPDASDGEAVEYLLDLKVPCVVFTGTFSEDQRERFLAQQVVDYVVKDSPASLEYLMDVVEQLHENRTRKVLVVDDAKTTRHYIMELLESYNLQALEAANGEQGLKILSENEDIQLVITDFHMPNMTGVEMVRRMRMTHGRDRMAIIGVSSGGGGALSANFIKNGANDYLNKPFLREEFFCRVMQNLRQLDLISKLKDMTIKDALTGIYNRRYLFEAGEGLFASARRDQIDLTVAMIDVDHFKSVNDTYGHDCGDAVLKAVAKTLNDACRRTDVVARFGGEEFAVVAVEMQSMAVEMFFNNLREKLANTPVECQGNTISVTASIGICHGPRESLQEMLKLADEKLYEAKANGRNRIEVI